MKPFVPNNVKKKVRLFLRSERGQVSKEGLLTLGAFLGSAALAGILAAKAAQGATTITFDKTGDGAIVRIRGSYS
ncbi:hypothetical protein J4439_07190 [Candidatus Woesearchaeota archaeon]|nr:hypothetical protein [Candidatus Woesearchaeota archaeon]